MISKQVVWKLEAQLVDDIDILAGLVGLRQKARLVSLLLARAIEPYQSEIERARRANGDFQRSAVLASSRLISENS